MLRRKLAAFLLVGAIAGAGGAGAWGQDKPEAGSPVENAVAREAKGLAADDFAQRDAALKRLQGLVAEQLKQRAQIQDVINAFQAELVQQQRSLAIVSDEEAQAQIAGLLEMERGLTAWTLQTMSEPVARRTELLNWGLTRENAPALARLYAENLRIRLDGVKQVAKLNDAGAQWTLGRLINDKESAVRAAAMAACWSREPNAAVVDALWFRAVSGPLSAGDGGRDGRMMADGRPGGDNAIKVDFPGGDPMEFDDANDAGDFSDAQLASDVLVHYKSPQVGDRIKALVAERTQLGKTLSLGSDPDWTLVTHRLVETYGVKEAIPLLAGEALAAESDEMGGDMNGRPYMWSRRTVAIGTLCKLIGKEPADLDLVRAHDSDNPRGWTWGVEVTQQQMMNGNPGDSDGPAVRAFYAFWKDHHAEYGVKEAPSGASVPPVPVPGQPQGPIMPRRFRQPPVPVDVGGDAVPPNGPGGDAPATVPATMPEAPPAVLRASPGNG